MRGCQEAPFSKEAFGSGLNSLFSSQESQSTVVHNPPDGVKVRSHTLNSPLPPLELQPWLSFSLHSKGVDGEQRHQRRGGDERYERYRDSSPSSLSLLRSLPLHLVTFSGKRACVSHVGHQVCPYTLGLRVRTC